MGLGFCFKMKNEEFNYLKMLYCKQVKYKSHKLHMDNGTVELATIEAKSGVVQPILGVEASRAAIKGMSAWKAESRGHLLEWTHPDGGSSIAA